VIIIGGIRMAKVLIAADAAFMGKLRKGMLFGAIMGARGYIIKSLKAPKVMEEIKKVVSE
jgi:predicted DNA-binding transcriptional regulator